MKNGKQNGSNGIPWYSLVFLVFASAFLSACNTSKDSNDDTTLLALLLTQSTSAPCSTRCHMFLSSNVLGTLVGVGGITGADALCNGDVGKVRGKTYKAMIAVPGVREVLGNPTGTLTYTDWVLKANTFYSNSTDTSNTTGSTTTSNRIFRDSNTTMQMNFALGTNGSRFWTGMTISGGNLANDVNCSNWTSLNGGVSGVTGVVGASTTTLVETTTDACNISKKVVCVEQ
ncbi:Len family endostatin-like outer membrane lipoprotein [Leptospira levettii]|uniref:Len family endostatin-like outer membrane lipoprotein n=1 Tax=Leptospira levettii TaxID=2023178 RepID=UPI003556A493